MLNKHPFLGVFLIFLGFKFLSMNGITYQACRGDFVVRLDGSTCLQLWNKEGRVVRREGDPL
ncbi:hypothetical protein ACVTMM_19465, partial [Escherichia coli]